MSASPSSSTPSKSMIAYLRSVEHGLRPSSLQDQEFKREFFFLGEIVAPQFSSRVGCQEAQCVGHSNAHVDAVEELPRALRRLGVRGRLLGPQGLRRCAPRTRPSPPRAPGSIPHLHSNAKKPIRDITWHPTLTCPVRVPRSTVQARIS